MSGSGLSSFVIRVLPGGWKRASSPRGNVLLPSSRSVGENGRTRRGALNALDPLARCRSDCHSNCASKALDPLAAAARHIFAHSVRSDSGLAGDSGRSAPRDRVSPFRSTRSRTAPRPQATHLPSRLCSSLTSFAPVLIPRTAPPRGPRGIRSGRSTARATPNVSRARRRPTSPNSVTGPELPGAHRTTTYWAVESGVWTRSSSSVGTLPA
mgnify:CR=1 FL=1